MKGKGEREKCKCDQRGLIKGTAFLPSPHAHTPPHPPSPRAHTHTHMHIPHSHMHTPHAHIHTPTCTHTHTHAHIHTHPHMHTCTHTHTCTSPHVHTFTQVSHHPPMFAMHAEHKEWTLWQEYTVASKFRGKYLVCYPIGSCHLMFHRSKSHYTWCKVATTIHNIIVGKLWVDQVRRESSGG